MVEVPEVGVVGAGYVGLVTGACLAHVGYRVTCLDKEEGRIAALEEGRVPFYEPGLKKFVEEAAYQGRLRFSTELSELAREAEVVFVAVGTPQGEDGSADLSNVAAVARSIGWALADATLGSGRSWW